MELPIREPCLAFICCMCENLAAAREKGLSDCGLSECGGPLIGRAFPLYKGPLTGNLTNFCFRCGRNSDVLMVVDNGIIHEQLGFCHLCASDLQEQPIDNDTGDP